MSLKEYKASLSSLCPDLFENESFWSYCGILIPEWKDYYD